MNLDRFDFLTQRFPSLQIAVVGDFCLDRYLEIDPTRHEVSIETGLPVHNVARVRSQPGGAGTILNNLVALGVGTIHAVGFCGADGEGYELQRALQAKPGVRLDHFLVTPERQTFTYCKPLVIEAGKTPVELSRLDRKNWSPTPASVEDHFIRSVQQLSHKVDAMILLEQVDVAETGVLTAGVLATLHPLLEATPRPIIIADSRRGLKGYPPVHLKMNRAELSALTGQICFNGLPELKATARRLADQTGAMVFVSLANDGIIGAAPGQPAEHVPALPLRGEIDIVGAGDAVTANLASALAAGARQGEALELASVAASIVIHQLGTTGTASVPELRALLAWIAAVGTA